MRDDLIGLMLENAYLKLKIAYVRLSTAYHNKVAAYKNDSLEAEIDDVTREIAGIIRDRVKLGDLQYVKQRMKKNVQSGNSWHVVNLATCYMEDGVDPESMGINLDELGVKPEECKEELARYQAARLKFQGAG